MSFIQITFRSIPHSSAVEYHINKHFKKISRIYNKVNNCKVVIDTEQKSKHKGKLFGISIYMTIPGHELVCKKQNQNVYVAIREVFHGLEKLLKKHGKRKLTSADNFLNYIIKNKGNITNAPSSLEMI
jgi:ribosomal subunit interface protein